jgi:multisubunit Na+/H+ antiporter MnhB subunit
MTTVPASDARPTSRPDRRRLETPRAAGIAGLAFAALFITALVLMRSQPSSQSSAAEIRNFYLREHGGTVALVGVYLVPFAGIAFLWFIAVVRNLIGDGTTRSRARRPS